MEHKSAGRRRRIDRLREALEPDPARSEFVNGCNECGIERPSRSRRATTSVSPGCRAAKAASRPFLDVVAPGYNVGEDLARTRRSATRLSERLASARRWKLLRSRDMMAGSSELTFRWHGLGEFTLAGASFVCASSIGADVQPDYNLSAKLWRT
jgi:hypothetical protein